MQTCLFSEEEEQQRNFKPCKLCLQGFDFGACSDMEAPPRFELGVKALQASALPLGYGALRSKRAAQALLEFVLERKTRFELATFALARRRSTTEPLPQNVATRMRLELTTSSVTG